MGQGLSTVGGCRPALRPAAAWEKARAPMTVAGLPCRGGGLACLCAPRGCAPRGCGGWVPCVRAGAGLTVVGSCEQRARWLRFVGSWLRRARCGLTRWGDPLSSPAALLRHVVAWLGAPRVCAGCTPCVHAGARLAVLGSCEQRARRLRPVGSWPRRAGCGLTRCGGLLSPPAARLRRRQALLTDRRGRALGTGDRPGQTCRTTRGPSSAGGDGCACGSCPTFRGPARADFCTFVCGRAPGWGRAARGSRSRTQSGTASCP